MGLPLSHSVSSAASSYQRKKASSNTGRGFLMIPVWANQRCSCVQSNNHTRTSDFPKNADSKASVRMVKLCWPLSHLVTSLGRLPNAWANSSFDKPRSAINSLMRFEMATSMSTSCWMSAGTASSICLNDVFIVFIRQTFYRFQFYVVCKYKTNISLLSKIPSKK